MYLEIVNLTGRVFGVLPLQLQQVELIPPIPDGPPALPCTAGGADSLWKAKEGRRPAVGKLESLLLSHMITNRLGLAPHGKGLF